MRMGDLDFISKGVHFTGLCLVPNFNYTCFAVGNNDDRIWCNREDKRLINYDERTATPDQMKSVQSG